MKNLTKKDILTWITVFGAIAIGIAYTWHLHEVGKF